MSVTKLINYYLWRICEKPFEDQYPRLLAKELKGGTSLLDVGCGDGYNLNRIYYKPAHCVGVDIDEHSLAAAKEKGIYHELYKMNVMAIDSRFTAKSFDYVLCSDVIEHLSKEEGQLLIQKMQRIASKKLVIFTPNGFFPQTEKEGNRYQKHISGWTVDEMYRQGFTRIIGLHGFKGLCTKYPEPLFKPHFISRGLSSITQPIVLRIPRLSFQILCVKETN